MRSIHTSVGVDLLGNMISGGMKPNLKIFDIMKKNYTEPKFELVATDKSGIVFFAASGPAPVTSVGGSINLFTNTTAVW